MSLIFNFRYTRRNLETKGVDNHGVPSQGEGTLGTQRGFALTLSSTISSVVIAQTASLVMFNNLIT